ncbi:chaplin [Streptomyces sp. TRM64462]|uniref:chaplin n=1 Tax=Streptomyces sp. TRM64462 TaxID=2741726 RepID=UPI001585E225|nr:chaplin [Streptomyces sp. TRM64462]
MRLRTLLTASALAVTTFAALTATVGGAAADDTPWSPFGIGNSDGNIVQRPDHRPVNHCGNQWDASSPAAPTGQNQPQGNVCVNGR